MKQVLIILFFPLISFGQKATDKGYASITFQAGFYQSTNSVGGAMNLGRMVSKNNSIGLGIEGIHFKDAKSLYLPVYADFKFYIPGSKGLQIVPMIQPGYGIYSRTTGGYITQRGGFFFGGGLGFKSVKKPGIYMGVRYCTYGFRTEYSDVKLNSNINAVVVNIGLWL